MIVVDSHNYFRPTAPLPISDDLVTKISKNYLEFFGAIYSRAKVTAREKGWKINEEVELWLFQELILSLQEAYPGLTMLAARDLALKFLKDFDSGVDGLRP